LFPLLEIERAEAKAHPPRVGNGGGDQASGALAVELVLTTKCGLSFSLRLETLALVGNKELVARTNVADGANTERKLRGIPDRSGVRGTTTDFVSGRGEKLKVIDKSDERKVRYEEENDGGWESLEKT
jgi:hypothetical protein